jgi:ABC-type antimicrobial peptide transport system permease subunit
MESIILASTSPSDFYETSDELIQRYVDSYDIEKDSISEDELLALAVDWLSDLAVEDFNNFLSYTVKEIDAKYDKFKATKYTKSNYFSLPKRFEEMSNIYSLEGFIVLKLEQLVNRVSPSDMKVLLESGKIIIEIYHHDSIVIYELTAYKNNKPVRVNTV